MSGEIRSVGFVGLGDIGRRQALEIAKLPVSLTVFDKRPEAMEPFESKAKLAASLAELASESDLIGISVQDDAQVNECGYELLPAMRPGSVILVHATVSPDTVTALAERAKAYGVLVMDAPVTRTRMTGDGPFLFCPVGGEKALKAKVQPILDSFATDTLLVGPTGSAMALKICSNLASWCEIIVTLETVALAEAAGVPVESLLAVMGTNGILTPPMKIFAGLRGQPADERMKATIAAYAAAGEKDLKLAQGLAQRVDARAPMASFAQGIVKEMVLGLCRD